MGSVTELGMTKRKRVENLIAEQENVNHPEQQRESKPEPWSIMGILGTISEELCCVSPISWRGRKVDGKVYLNK